MRIDLHVHTNRHSPCSSIDPDELARLALDRGLDAIVITEHNVWWDQDHLRDLQSRHPSLRIYQGVEISTSERYDVVAISPLRFPVRPFMPFEELLRTASAVRKETFLFMPHAFRFHTAPTTDGERILSHMDGIEMNSVNILKADNWVKMDSGSPTRHRPRNESEYAAAQKRHALVRVFNSDAHHPLAVGAVCTYLSSGPAALPQDEAALARLLKTAGTNEEQDPVLLAKFLEMF